MSFETYFRACSYAMIACGVLALALAGGVGMWLALAFAAVLAASWRLAGTRWQLSERAGLFVVLLALPAFYLDWRFQRGGAVESGAQVYAGVSALVHFTLVLSSIKLLQIKSDRDWLFLYLISFFEVLLAAGLSAGPAPLRAPARRRRLWAEAFEPACARSREPPARRQRPEVSLASRAQAEGQGRARAPPPARRGALPVRPDIRAGAADLLHHAALDRGRARHAGRRAFVRLRRLLRARDARRHRASEREQPARDAREGRGAGRVARRGFALARRRARPLRRSPLVPVQRLARGLLRRRRRPLPSRHDRRPRPRDHADLLRRAD